MEYVDRGIGWDDEVGYVWSLQGPSGRIYMVYDNNYHTPTDEPSWRVWRGTEWVEPHSTLSSVLV